MFLFFYAGFQTMRFCSTLISSVVVGGLWLVFLIVGSSMSVSSECALFSRCVLSVSISSLASNISSSSEGLIT